MPQQIVSFQNVTKSYPNYYHITGGIKSFLFNIMQSIQELRQRRVVLEGISLDIYKGESFGFVGRNGAGKSTLLGLIAGVLRPDKGKVSIHGRVSPLLELGAGFHPELSGRENILLNGVLLGLTRAQVREHIDEIIEFSELRDFIDQPVRTYSSGMYAKLGFSVVATLEPEILLVDEILSVGDLPFVRKCDECFQKFRNDPNVSIVLVSHALETISRVCDRAAWIDGKQVRALGPANDVVKEYINANRPAVVVPAAVGPVPPNIWGGTPLLNCSRGTAMLPLHLLADAEDVTIRTTLLRWSDQTPLREWLAPAQNLQLTYAEGDWELTIQSEVKELPPTPLPREALSSLQDDDAAVPLVLRLRGELGGNSYTPEIWIPVAARKTALHAWAHHRGEVLQRLAPPRPYAPYWPPGITVRVVACNIVSYDEVGHFAVGLAGMLTSYGIPNRVYAYQSGADLAGVVTSLGDLQDDLRPTDILFYHYSTEDKFLSQIVNLDCKKLLYYHNVRPSAWIRDYNPTLATEQDRAQSQFPLFIGFDSVLANSQYNLAEIEKFLSGSVQRGVCPPCVDPERLLRQTPEPMALPDGDFVLWVGGMTPHKRPKLALEIFHALSKRRPDLRFVMVGGGLRDLPDYIREIDQIMQGMPESMRERLSIFDSLADSQLAFLYRQARLLLCTSAHAGFCLPVLEAKTFGLPVATCEMPAVLEHLDAAHSLVISDAPEDAAAAIDARLVDGGLRPAVPLPSGDDSMAMHLLEALTRILE